MPNAPRVTLVLLLGLLVTEPLHAQSLGEVARREKKRREENQRAGVAVREISEREVRNPPSAASESSGESAPLAGADVHPEPGAPGPPAPDFTLPDRLGRTVSLSQLRGRPVLLDFWATWCAPCRATMPEVERLHRRYGRELQVIGINIEGNSPEVLRYLDAGGYSFRVLFDSGNWDSGVARSYGVTSIPRTFLIDHRGRIVYSGHPNGLGEDVLQNALAH